MLMLKNSYAYSDKYMYFIFNGINSSQYNLFMENSGNLVIENNIGATSSFSKAYKQEGTYLLGTSRSQKTIKRKCASQGLTRDQYKDMMLWLTPGNTGELILCDNSYWGWYVVIDDVNDADMWDDDDNLIVEFDITFKTIGTYLAHNVWDAVWYTNQTELENLCGVRNSNHYGIPTIITKSYSTNDYYLFILDINNKIQNFELTTSTLAKDAQVTLALDQLYVDRAYYQASPQQYGRLLIENKMQYKFNSQDAHLLQYNSATGLLLLDNMLAEQSAATIYNYQPHGLINITNKTPKIFNVQCTDVDTDNTAIYVDVTSIIDLLQSEHPQAPGYYYLNYDYAVIDTINGTSLQYGISQYNMSTLLDNHVSCYGFASADAYGVSLSLPKYIILLSSGTYTMKIPYYSGDQPNVQEGDYVKLYMGYLTAFHYYYDTTNIRQSLVATVQSYNNM